MMWIKGVRHSNVRNKWQIKTQFRGQDVGVKQVMQFHDSAVTFLRHEENVVPRIKRVLVNNCATQNKRKLGDRAAPVENVLTESVRPDLSDGKDDREMRINRIRIANSV
jgi:hypothetical protein